VHARLSVLPFLYSLSPPPPRSTLFPYTTLFRSKLRPPTASLVPSGLNARLQIWCSVPRSGSRPCPVLRSHISTFAPPWPMENGRSEEHTSELQSLTNLVCRLLLEKKKYWPQLLQ